ncbi:MFS transporter [Halogranum amylolyticum]|uniref:MFS transporter n=1 Tax=Halogranum amylolyticum TaxID=660520 RepID=UPI000B7F208F|nr:MFS transporter [Halogranum amylolyticum]
MTSRLFGTLCGFVFLVNFGRVAFAPLVEPLRTEFGIGSAAVGLVISLVWWGSALPRIPVGVLLTRVPRHRVVLGTGVLLTAAAAFTASATSLLTLQLGAFCIGLASGAYFVSAVPLLGELYPESVGRVVGIHGMASQLAAVVVPTVAVWLLSQATWRAVFWLLTAAAAVVTLALAVVADGDTVPENADADRDFLAALTHWRTILLGVVMVAALGFVWQGLFNFYVEYMTTVKGLSPTTAGTMLTVVFAAGVPAFWLSGRLADRLPNVPYVLAIHLAFVVCLVALTLVSSRAALFAVTAAIGYVVHSLFPALDTYVLGVLPADNRAAAYAVFSGTALLLEAGGSGTLGYLREVGLGFDVVFLAAAGGLTAVLLGLTALYVLDAFPRPAAEPTDASVS